MSAGLDWFRVTDGEQFIVGDALSLGAALRALVIEAVRSSPDSVKQITEEKE